MDNSTAVADKYNSITSLNSHTSPLLRLPAELRNKIYLYIAKEGIYNLEYRPRPPRVYPLAPKYKKSTPQWTGLVPTCRQLHAEAGLLPYSANIFSATDIGH